MFWPDLVSVRNLLRWSVWKCLLPLWIFLGTPWGQNRWKRSCWFIFRRGKLLLYFWVFGPVCCWSYGKLSLNLIDFWVVRCRFCLGLWRAYPFLPKLPFKKFIVDCPVLWSLEVPTVRLQNRWIIWNSFYQTPCYFRSRKSLRFILIFPLWFFWVLRGCWLCVWCSLSSCLLKFTVPWSSDLEHRSSSSSS